jgi:hypothetical protein
MSKKQTVKSFWNRVDKRGPNDCWEWLGARNNTGYGTVAWHGKVYTAHRLAAFLEGLVDGALAPKLKSDKSHVLHKCDNRACCNPKHFFLGSYSDNQLDAYRKRRRSQPKGEAHANAKLTQEQAIEIRRRYSAGELQIPLAKEFKVSQRAISLIVRGETYK